MQRQALHAGHGAGFAVLALRVAQGLSVAENT
jgi:hypothetical protein